MDHAGRSSLNCFAGVPVERLTEKRQDQSWLSDTLPSNRSRFLPIFDTRPLINSGEERSGLALLNRAEAGPILDYCSAPVLLGRHEEGVCFAVQCPEDLAGSVEKPGIRTFRNLREVAVQLPAYDAALVAYARAMVYWHTHHRYCGSCGHPNRSGDAGHVLICQNPECGTRRFPRTDPAIIVLVHHGDACLLARQASWPERHYATLAGFVEPGESLEQAVVREIMEEAGVGLEEIDYHASQPWPFPGSIMLGYFARAAHRSLQIDRTELEDAVWLTRSEIRERLEVGSLRLSPRLSISYRLIEHWFDADRPGSLNDLLKRLEASVIPAAASAQDS